MAAKKAGLLRRFAPRNDEDKAVNNPVDKVWKIGG
jgi:hypothetical protein